MSRKSPENLKVLLEKTLEQCSTDDRLDSDPVGLVHPYERPEDREIAALFASCLAYGRVAQLRGAIREALSPLDPHPARWLTVASRDAISALWHDFTYRMTRGVDLRDLAWAASRTLRREGSLRALYLSVGESDPIRGVEDHLRRAGQFVGTLRSRRLRPQLHRGFRYLLPDPRDGSACKRLHLFFRWMVRGPDAVDLGLWDRVEPSALIMPLDTHTSRLCRYLGLVERKSVDAKAARLVTDALSQLDPHDPLRYDFALCHLGISGRCIHRRSPQHCPGCPIEPACVLPEE